MPTASKLINLIKRRSFLVFSFPFAAFEMSLSGKISLVTGASRGLGKGIAIELGRQGATVYVSGRPPQSRLNFPNTSSLDEVAQEVSIFNLPIHTNLLFRSRSWAERASPRIAIMKIRKKSNSYLSELPKNKTRA
jgi:short-subunit dehydrogenase